MRAEAGALGIRLSPFGRRAAGLPYPVSRVLVGGSPGVLPPEPTTAEGTC